MRLFLILLLCGSVFVSCTPTKVDPDGTTTDGATKDAGTADTVKADTATTDTSKPDTAVADTATPDAGPADAGPADTTTTDAAPTDAAPTDAGPADAAPTDAAPTDAAPTDAAPTDAAPTDATPTDATPTDATPGATMSFFITSVGLGDGAKLGGLAGADAHCKKLAEAAGTMGKTWAAYLSTSTENAKDRIGAGPWHNAKGTMVAKDVADLHSASNALNKQNSLTEAGAIVNGKGDTPNQHDILTGSKADGTVNPGKTCADWTSNSTGSATVGHHDRDGGGAAPTSWNSAHDSRSCSQADLVATGGNGYFYCFAK